MAIERRLPMTVALAAIPNYAVPGRMTVTAGSELSPAAGPGNVLLTESGQLTAAWQSANLNPANLWLRLASTAAPRVASVVAALNHNIGPEGYWRIQGGNSLQVPVVETLLPDARVAGVPDGPDAVDNGVDTPAGGFIELAAGESWRCSFGDPVGSGFDATAGAQLIRLRLEARPPVQAPPPPDRPVEVRVYLGGLEVELAALAINNENLEERNYDVPFTLTVDPATLEVEVLNPVENAASLTLRLHELECQLASDTQAEYDSGWQAMALLAGPLDRTGAAAGRERRLQLDDFPGTAPIRTAVHWLLATAPPNIGGVVVEEPAPEAHLAWQLQFRDPRNPDGRVSVGGVALGDMIGGGGSTIDAFKLELIDRTSVLTPANRSAVFARPGPVVRAMTWTNIRVSSTEGLRDWLQGLLARAGTGVPVLAALYPGAQAAPELAAAVQFWAILRPGSTPTWTLLPDGRMEISELRLLEIL
jgi:hypothetical protein